MTSVAELKVWPRGVVFDLDGTLTDNMPIHRRAFDAFAVRYGLPPLDEPMRLRLDGKRNSDIFPILFGADLAPERGAALAEEKEILYREMSRGLLRPLPGLLKFLDLLAARSIPIAIATSAPAANVPHSLRELGLAERFLHVARSDEEARGKPFPDVFLAAARKIGVAPEHCLAFEDAPSGIAAARAAGMTSVAITTSFKAQHFAEHALSFHVADYEEFLSGPARPLLALH